MRSDLSKKRAASPRKSARKSAPKAPAKAPRKIAEKSRKIITKRKNGDIYVRVKLPKKRPEPDREIVEAPRFDPTKLKQCSDILMRQSERFRFLFPKKWDEVKCAMTPLDVMLTAMQLEMTGKTPNWPLAAKIAKDIMPYMHPRLTHIHATMAKGQLDELSPEQLAWIAASLRGLTDEGAFEGRVIDDEGESGSDPGGETQGTSSLFALP